jgi:guanine nucleotide exchange factor VAV
MWCFRFAGPMERSQAEVELLNCENSTFLVRHRTKESAEYAISIKYVLYYLVVEP